MSTVGRDHPAKRLVVLKRTLEHPSDGAMRHGVALPSKGHFALLDELHASQMLPGRDRKQSSPHSHIHAVSSLDEAHSDQLSLSASIPRP